MMHRCEMRAAAKIRLIDRIYPRRACLAPTETSVDLHLLHSAPVRYVQAQ